jgi:hypothetical protein
MQRCSLPRTTGHSETKDLLDLNDWRLHVFLSSFFVVPFEPRQYSYARGRPARPGQKTYREPLLERGFCLS